MILTNEEIMDVNQNHEFDSAIGFARAIESAVIEKIKAGCDMSAMDGREYETMWCDRAQFEKLCIGISAIIEKRTIERCAVTADEIGDTDNGFGCAAAIRAME